MANLDSSTYNRILRGDYQITIDSEPINSPSMQGFVSVNQFQFRGIDMDGVDPYQVTQFNQFNTVRVFGKYSENFLDVPQYDLSELSVVNDDEIQFNYILSIVDNNGAIPYSYCTPAFIDKLNSQLNLRRPYGVNELLHQRSVVLINLAPIKALIDDLRLKELGLDIDITNSNERTYVKVLRNLFMISNFRVDSVSGLKANPKEFIKPLIEYVAWVTTKPSGDYKNRLLPADYIGDFRGTLTPGYNEVSNFLDVGLNFDEYAPIGRKGSVDEEEALYNGKYYSWDEELQKWERVNGLGTPIITTTSGNVIELSNDTQVGGGPTGTSAIINDSGYSGGGGNTGSGNQSGTGTPESGNQSELPSWLQ